MRRPGNRPRRLRHVATRRLRVRSTSEPEKREQGGTAGIQVVFAEVRDDPPERPSIQLKGQTSRASLSLPAYRIPARMKLCTNCRWNNRKPTSSGAEVMSVAAQM